MIQRPKVAAHQIERAFDLSAMQQGMLLRHRECPDDRSYVMQVRYCIEGPFDPGLFEQAIRVVSERHPMLRAGFVSTGLAVPKTVIYRQVEPRIQVRRGPIEAQTLDALCAQEIQEGFDLRFAPLTKWLVVQTQDQQFEVCKTYHHLITDGFSSARVMRELMAVYLRLHQKGSVEDSVQDLGPPPVDFAEYIKWLSAQPKEDARSYWRSRLQGMQALRSSRGGRDEQSVQSCELSLSRGLSQGLSRWCQDQACTVASLLQGVLGLLIRLDQGERSAVLGVVSRLSPPHWGERDFAVGPMIATLPMPLPDLRWDQAWSDSIRAIQDLGFQDRQHAKLSLAEISALAPAHLRGGSLFDALLVVENWGSGLPQAAPSSAGSLPAQASELRVSTRGLRDGSEYPLTVYAVPGECWGFRLHVDEARFGRGAAQRWADGLVEVLGSILEASSTIENSARRIGAKSSLVTKDPADARDWDPWARLEHWAQVQPEAVAVQMGPESWSYAELLRRSQSCAGFLASQGIGPEDRVAILGPRGPWMLVAILGIWARGAAFVPVDLEGPIERARVIAEDAQLAASLCAPEWEPPEAWLDGSPIFAYQQWSQSGEASAPMASHPEQLAYVMWTSGSTGTPKGVAVSRGALSHFLSAMRQVIPMQFGERWLSITGLGFDISLLELFYPMMVGGRCELVDRGTAQDGQALARRLQTGDVQVFQATPSSWQMILDAGLSAPELLALCGGEALSPSLARGLSSRVGRLINVYGPTEATIWASAGPVDGQSRAVSIGQALAGVRLDAIDPHHDASLGQGELCIAGPTLARGYWRSPSQTALAFVPDPLGDGSRRYRTGDLGYCNLHGQWFCLGRVDRQVKIRGHRIDLLEIEAAMVQSDLGLREACALLVPEGQGNPILVGAYTAGAAVEHAELRARVSRALPLAAVPVRWVQLHRFPSNDRNKRDDRAIAQMIAASRGGWASSHKELTVLPEGGLESLVNQLWVQHLGQGGTADDDFFAQGGHSLVAMRMSARLEPVLGHQVPVAWLLSHPRRQAWIARLMNGPGKQVPGDQEPGAQLQVRSAWPDYFTATPGQRRFFWLEQRAKRPGHYNLMVAVALQERVDAGVWKKAFEDLCDLHPMLRTRLTRRDDRLCCEVYPGRPGDQDDAWGWVPVRADDDADSLMQRANEYPFDLESKPAWRAQICDHPPGGSALVFCAHHALVDGRSMEILMRDLALLVIGRGKPTAPAADFSDYARWMEALDQEGELDRHAAFWRERLPARVTPSALAFAGFGPLEPMTERRPRIQLDAEFCQRWRAFNQAQMCTHFMVLLAAMFRWLVPMTGQTHLCIGAPHQGRSDRRLADVVGPLISTLAWSMDLSDRPDTKRLLAKVRSLVLEGQKHELAPLERSYDGTQGTPFVALLSLQVQSGKVEAPRAEYLARPSAGHKGALTVYAKLSDDGAVLLELSYDPQRWSASHAKQALELLQDCLRDIVDNKSASLPRLPALGAESLRPLAAPGSLIEAFVQVAKANPEAVALEYESLEFRYGPLWREVQGLASALANQGVGVGDLVALDLPRGLPMVMGILGVLACGAAYLPLERDWPEARKQQLIEKAKAIGPLEERDDTSRWSFSTLLRCKSPIRDLSHRWSAELVAYVLYTSGSTGEPKGVAVTHRNVMSLLRACSQRLSLSKQDCWSCTHSFSFDFSVWELWGAFVHGARLRILSHQERKDPQRVLEVLRAAKVTVFSQTPSAFYAFAATAIRQGDASVLTSLRYVIFGGESLDNGALAPWRSWAQKRGPSLINMFGITETTVHVTAGKVPHEGVASVGLPLPGVNVELVAPDLSPVYPGAQGEILVGGWGVSWGYWNNPRLTAQRFLPDPHAGPGARRYLSGDWGRILPDGTLLHAGRKDTQVQIRGHRVEPEELAARIQAHPGVEQATVLVQRDAQGIATGLVGFYTEKSAVGEEVLLRFVQQSLPSYLCPQTLHRVASFPRTANDKLDKSALRALADQQAASKTDAPFQSGLEELIAQRFSRILGKPAGAEDDFFTLGGHSLLAVDLVHDLSAAIGQAISVGQFLENPSPRSLARQCVAKRSPGVPRWVTLDGQAQDTWVLCIHPGGGHLQGYLPLAKRLSEAQLQVWGVACPSMDDPSYLASSISQMAQDYLSALLDCMASHPVRRVHLLGWSSGAVVAAAMAHRWPSEAPPLQSLLLLDPPTPGRSAGSDSGFGTGAQAEAIATVPGPDWPGFLAALGVGEADARVSALPEEQRSRLEQGWAKAHAQGNPWEWLSVQVHALEPGPRLSADFWRWRYERLVHASLLVSRYAPEPLGVPVHLWRAKSQGSSLAQGGASSWICAPSVREYGYAGSHRAIVSDDAVAQRILTLIADTSQSS